MALVLTDIGVGTTEGDSTGDKARVGGLAINANNALIETAIEFLQGRNWTIRNTTLNPLVIGARYMANNHAGITFTLPAVFSVSATALSDIWVANADDAASVTLTPASGDALFVAGVTLGVDATYALPFGKIAILSPRTTDSEWDVVLTSSGGGDFLADGSVDMTGEFRTDVGTMDSDVADGASANAWVMNTANTYATAGANLLQLQNNATPVFDFSYQGGIDHKNSGATTAAHSQSLNMNWSSLSTKTSSGSFSAVIGRNNTASGHRSFACGDGNTSSGEAGFASGITTQAAGVASVAFGSYTTANGARSFVVGTNGIASGDYSAAFGMEANATQKNTIAIGTTNVLNAGDVQSMWTTLYAVTTDATQTTLKTHTDNYVIPADASWAFSALVIGRSDESDGNDSAAYRIEGCLTRDESNNTALVGSVTKTVIAESAGATAWDATAEADDTNEALAIKVTGEAATNIRWVAKVDIAQVTYA